MLRPKSPPRSALTLVELLVLLVVILLLVLLVIPPLQMALPPSFPWPPPRYSSFYTIPDDCLTAKPGKSTLGDVAADLEKMLGDAGYSERGFYAIPNGFAIVTRLEQINEDGSPKAGGARWIDGYKPPRIESLKDYVRELLRARTGQFRVIVITVTDASVSPGSNSSTPATAKRWAFEGAVKLPDTLAEQSFGKGFSVTALVYEFQRKTDEHDPEFNAEGQLSGKTHLEQAGILPKVKEPE